MFEDKLKEALQIRADGPVGAINSAAKAVHVGNRSYRTPKLADELETGDYFLVYYDEESDTRWVETKCMCGGPLFAIDEGVICANCQERYEMRGRKKLEIGSVEHGT